MGSGKTLMALQVIHRMQEHLGRRLKVNWVAPRRHLLQQVMEFNMGYNQENIRPVSLFERYPPSADFVVLDEAHHEATQSCVLLYEKMHHTWTLGLSATPLRTDRMKLSFQDTVNTCFNRRYNGRRIESAALLRRRYHNDLVNARNLGGDHVHQYR